VRERLINAVIKNKNRLSYINLNANNKYRGWTYDFNIILPNGTKMSLDLRNEDDLFLLFVLASYWSRNGQWENAAFFTTYIKESKKNKVALWLDNAFVNSEINNRKMNSQSIVKLCRGLIARKKISFRSDCYSSIAIIAKNWEEIKSKLELSNIQDDFMIFINFIRTLDGLGEGKNRMMIKIPLILRELRCQSIYNNIPGELCCVADKRVMLSSKEIGIKIPYINSTDSLLKASKVIYECFGDLYDIPLFAYDDVKADM
jgi:hypothetical protein